MNRRKFMSRTGFILPVLLSLAIMAGAGAARAGSGEAGSGGEFLRYGAGARAMAMGGAYTALADDATAVFWNPAGLAQLSRPSLQFMQTELHLDSRLLYGAAGYPCYGFPDRESKLAFGLGLLGFRMEGFEPYSADDRFLGGSFDDSQMALSASAAYDRISHLGRLAAGVNLIAFNHELNGYSDWGAGADFGIMAQLINPPRWSLLGIVPIRHLMPWRFGAVYHAATGEELLRSEQDYPNSFSLGLSNSDIRIPSVPGKLVASYQFDRVLSSWREEDHRIGCEYQLPLYGDFMLSMRGGVNLSAESGDESGYSWGFGLRGCDISLLGWKGFIGLDFAQRPHPVLSSANFLSLRMVFGPGSPESEVQEPGADLGSAAPSNLIRRFMNYPRDPALAHPDSAASGSSRRGYYRIGRELRNSLAAGSENHNRYDEFILGITGWLFRIRRAVEDYRELVIENKVPSGGSDNLQESLRNWRGEFGSFLDDCAGRLDRLTRTDNIEALRYYITDLILAGRGDEVDEVVSEKGLASRNRAFSEWDRHYFLALSDPVETASLKKVLRTDRPGIRNEAYLRVYLEFLLGIREKDVDLLDQVIGRNESGVFALSYYPATPFIPDGIIADDAILLKNCIQIVRGGEMERERIREMLSDPLERFTGGSAFNILSAHIDGAATGEQLREAAGKIVEFYRTNSGADGIFWPR
ncbi:MAG: hypothetical protein GF417_10180 [Candidatus Latescibacteria bacterium]|nr:hypothetical protein [bacterium]MBD3424794.1 hypothetical protein [Candidatus Latescibacterota bacterium]